MQLVPKENLLGEYGKGHVIAFNILNIGRYKLGVGAVGAAKRAFDVTVQYTNQRQQFKHSDFPILFNEGKISDNGIEIICS